MARLTARTRSKIPTGKFALPGRRFPIHDKTHARVAKSYASRMAKKGQLSGSQKATIDAKANRMLGRADGGPIGNIKPIVPPKPTGFQGLVPTRLKPEHGGPIRPSPFPMKKRAGGKMGLRGYKTGGPVPANVNPFDNTARTRAALPDYE